MTLEIKGEHIPFEQVVSAQKVKLGKDDTFIQKVTSAQKLLAKEIKKRQPYLRSYYRLWRFG